ncbi:MAG: type IV pilin [Thermoplasmatota archaeon]
MVKRKNWLKGWDCTMVNGKQKINRKRVSPIFHRNGFSRFFNSDGVSEVIGVILILAIVMGVMTGVYLLVFDTLNSDVNRAPSVEIGISVNEAGNEIIFEHRGGPSLSKDLDITINIGGDRIYNIEPGTTNLPLGTEIWSFGDRMVYAVDPEITSVRGLYVHVLIVDRNTGAVLVDSIVQDGDKLLYPFASFSHSVPLYNDVTLYLDWATRDYDSPVSFYFIVREKPPSNLFQVDFLEPDTVTRHEVTGSGQSGTASFGIKDLDPETIYECVAVANFTIGANIVVRRSAIYEFRTFGYILGNWRFPAAGNGSFSRDVSGYNNHGVFNYVGAFTRVTPGVSEPVGQGDAAMFYGIDNYMNVADSASLKEPKENVTIEAWVQKKVDDTYTSFDQPVISSAMSFDKADFPMSEIPRFNEDDESNDIDFIQVHEKYYAKVFRDVNNHGWVVTVEIDDTGIITYRDKHRFRNDITFNPRIAHVYDKADYKVFAVVYTTTTSNRGGQIQTLAINNDGMIKTTGFTPSIRELENTATYFNEPDIITIRQGVFWYSVIAVVYGTNQGGPTNSAYKQKIVTLNIVLDNTITLPSSPQNSQIFCYMNPNNYGTNLGSGSTIFWVYDDVYAVMYSDAETPNRPGGRITTFTINEFTGRIEKLQTGTSDSVYILGSCFNTQVIRLHADGGNSRVYFSAIYQFYYDGEGQNLMHLYALPFYIKFDGEFKKEFVLETNELNLRTISSPTFRWYAKVAELYRGTDEIRLVVVYSDPDFRGLMATLKISLIDYTISIINSETRFSHGSQNPTIIPVNNSAVITAADGITLFAVAHRARWDRRGEIKTIYVSNDGTLPNTYDNNIMIHSYKLYLGPPVGLYTDMIHVTGDYYALAYRDMDVEGIIRVIEIDDDGAFIESDVNNYIFAGRADYPRLIKISEDSQYSYVAIVYNGNQSFMTITTIKINKNNGEITHIDDFLSSHRILTGFQSGDGSTTHRSEIDIIHVRDVLNSHQTFAIVCIHNNYYAYLHVVNITNTGSIVSYHTSQQIHSSTHPPHMTPSIAHIRDDFFAIAYTTRTRSWGHSLYVAPIEINENGNILKKTTRTIYTHGSAYHGAYFPSLISVEGKYIAIAATVNEYYNSGRPRYGMIWTYTVEADGNIGGSATDTLRFNSRNNGQHQAVYNHLNAYIRAQKLLHLQNDIYLITHRGGIGATESHHAHLQLIRINSTTGRIKDDRITDRQFENEFIRYVYSNPIKITQDNDKFILTLAYTNRHQNGLSAVFVTVKNIRIDITDNPLQPLVAKGGLQSNNGYGLFINETRIVGKINDQHLTVYTADLLDGQWNYIVLTKINDNIKLYINAVLKDQLFYPSEITPNSNSLLFAQYFPVLLDEVTIRVKPMTQEQISEQYALL